MIHVYSRKGMKAMKYLNSAAASVVWFLARHLAWENTCLKSPPHIHRPLQPPQPLPQSPLINTLPTRQHLADRMHTFNLFYRETLS